MKTRTLIKYSTIGVIVTPILAAKATPKAIKLIKKEESKTNVIDVESKLTILDKVKVVWPCYIPTIIAGLITISRINKLADKCYPDKTIIIVNDKVRM